MRKPATRWNGAARCAIYTRKSSEESLEQEFNSLQARREALRGLYHQPTPGELGVSAGRL